MAADADDGGEDDGDADVLVAGDGCVLALGVDVCLDVEACRSSGLYWGMYCGPLRAFGFVNGVVASQARKATS